MEKEMRNCSTRASSSKPPLIFPNTAEQGNLTKPERLVSNLKHLSFAAGLLALANQAAEEYESLPVRIQEDACKRETQILDSDEQRKRDLMMQQRAKSISTKEASGVCKRFVGNSLSFEDLLVLANTASVAFHREGSSHAYGSEELVASGVEEHTCKQREDGDADRGGSCFGLPEELGRNREVMQQRCKTEVAKPNIDPCDGCREDKLFEKKYVRKKRANHNKEHLESTSVGVVAGSSNIGHKSSRLINVDDAQREEEEGLYNNGEPHSKSEQVEGVEGQGGCSGIKNKTNSETQSRDENQEITHNSSLIPHILDIKNLEIPKRKRSQRKRKPKEPKKNSDSSQGERREEKESACDQIDSDTEAEEDNDADKMAEEEEVEEEENTIPEADLNQTVLGSDTANEEIVSESEDSLPLLEEAETEEKDVSESEDSLPLLEESETEEEEDVSDASSCNWWSFKTQPRTCKRIRNVQWRNKKKRNSVTLEETQSNRKILLLAVEAITNQLGLLDISMKTKKSS